MTDLVPQSPEAAAADARERLTESIAMLKSRLAPRSMVQNVVRGVIDKGQSVAQGGLDTAKKHPAPLVGAIATIGLFLFRKPLTRLATRARDATSPIPNSSPRISAKPARRKAE